MPVLHTAQNKLHSVDSESKHKHRLTGKFPGWNLSRRWNNLRGTTSRESQLQQWLQTPSPPLPGFVPKDRRTHLNSNILSIFMVKLIQYWGNDNDIAVCETKASQIRYYERWHDPRPSSHHASEQINQSRSFLSSSVWFICFNNKPQCQWYFSTRGDEDIWIHPGQAGSWNVCLHISGCKVITFTPSPPRAYFWTITVMQ